MSLKELYHRKLKPSQRETIKAILGILLMLLLLFGCGFMWWLEGKQKKTIIREEKILHKTSNYGNKSM